MTGSLSRIVSLIRTLSLRVSIPPVEIHHNAVVGVLVQFKSRHPTTVEIARAKAIMTAHGARSFSEPGTVLITSVVTRLAWPDPLAPYEELVGDPREMCPASGLDAAFFSTPENYVPFSFGTFSEAYPLQLTVEPTTMEPVAPLNMVLIGDVARGGEFNRLRQVMDHGLVADIDHETSRRIIDQLRGFLFFTAPSPERDVVLDAIEEAIGPPPAPKETHDHR